jgi:hypothetical protein
MNPEMRVPNPVSYPNTHHFLERIMSWPQAVVLCVIAIVFGWIIVRAIG